MELNKCSDNNEEVKSYVNDEFPTKLKVSIEQIIEREGYVNYEVNKRLVSSQNGNYLGILYAIDVKGQTKNGEKETNIFVKNIRPTDYTLKILSMSHLYDIEMFVYKELFKVFEEVQDEANLPIKKRYKIVKSFEETNREAIIMENIVKKGFDTYYRMEVASLTFVKMAIRELAKFHGLSFVIREKKPEFFEKKVKPLKAPFIFEEAWKPFVGRMKDITLKSVDRQYKNRVEKELDSVVEKYPNFFNDDSVKVCLCHGDYRPNNIMTKMENGVEQEVIPVDYQLVWFGNPVFDIIYFMYFSTDRDFRKAHMSEIKDLYYETLTNFLSNFNLDANSVYPRNEFERVFKEKLNFGLTVSLLYLSFMFIPDDAVPDMEVVNYEVDDKFKKRLRGVIEDYIELGYM